jgi:TolB-like protein/predicted Ser/Thr protein kinase
MIGKTISHYEIRSKIGAGGMGVVYKAWDNTLGRDVALKFLPDDLARDEAARKRFLHEARAAAALDHENICTVHEAGESDGHAFIAMHYVEGRDLREKIATGPVPLGDALDLVAQIARGLSAAHKSGIYHRDIKPANVLLTPDSQAKIVDFGLAKITTGTNLTQTGTTLGTVAYMSPEQARGDEVDSRTDVWSLGVVLYEMLAGRRPFDADADQATLYSILNTDAEPVSSIDPAIPLEVERVIVRALEKDASRRYSSIDEFLADIEDLRQRQAGLGGAHPLRRWLSHHRRQVAIGVVAVVAISAAAFAVWQFGPGQGDKIDSIAVLPFENLSPGEEQDMMANGVFIQVNSYLSGIDALKKIAPRTSVMRYRDTDKSLLEIGSELDVRGLVTGTYQQDRDRVMITVALVDARDENEVWSQAFTVRLTNVLSLQAQIARAIADEIKVTLTPVEEEILSVERKVDPGAYKQVALGEQKWNECVTDNKWELAGEVFEHYHKAVEIDTTYVEAWAGLAMLYAFKCQSVDDDEERSCRLAREYAIKAISLEDKSAEAHLALAAVALSVDFDWDTAGREYQRAMVINRRASEGWYGHYLLQAGRFTEAVEVTRRMVEGNPLDELTLQQMGFVLYSARRYDEAIAQCLEVLDMHPDAVSTKSLLARCYFATGRMDEGVALQEELGNEPLASQRATMGQRRELDKFFEDYKAYPPGAYHVAHVYCCLGDEAAGDLDSAMVYLEKAYEIQPEDLLQINTDAGFDILRPDPRFEALMKRAGIPAGELEYLYN